MGAAEQTHYEILGVTADADAATIRRAWRTLVQEWHPDRFQDAAEREQAEQRAKQINEAWSTLRDPNARCRYDRVLECAANDHSPTTAFERGPFGSTRRSSSSHNTGQSAAAAPPPGFARSVVLALHEIWAAARRHQQLTVPLAAVWCLLIAWSVFSWIAAPSLPASLEGDAAVAAAATPAPATDTVTADAELADERIERMQRSMQLLEEEAEAQAAAARAEAARARTRAARAAAERARRAAREAKPAEAGDGGRAQRVRPGAAPAGPPPGVRVIRVLPRE